VVVGVAEARAGQLALRAARAEAARRGAELVPVHEDGEPAARLAAESHTADLLVLGCHHSDVPEGARLGAVPTAVLAQAACPVMLVGQLAAEAAAVRPE
jgi:nucleotide-binding universal stress UspA family protein